MVAVGFDGLAKMLVKSLIFQTCQVLVLGSVVALLANQLSPRGLDLRRDYFKESQRLMGDQSTAATTNTVATEAVPRPGDSSKRVPEITAEEALSVFRDSRRAPGRVIFVDARKESVFLEGHIPDAYPFDRFYPEKDLPSVVLAGAGAERIVVYCTGGSCEDSHYAALQLIEAGLDPSRTQVFAGGFTEWNSHSWPVERGARGSGLVSNPLP